MNRTRHLVLPIALASFGLLAGPVDADNGTRAARVDTVTPARDTAMDTAIAEEDRYRARLAKLEGLWTSVEWTRFWRAMVTTWCWGAAGEMSSMRVLIWAGTSWWEIR